MADNIEAMGDNEEEADIITLQDEAGKDVEFYHVATLDYKNEWYVFLQPVESIEGIAEDEVIIYKLGTDDDGEDTFIPIEDEEELNAVFNEYLKESESDECCCGDDCDCNDSECDDKCGCGCKDKE